ncbi:hypothetical protein FJ950_11690 [Mesorhizobium sp. B2-3-14]|uniref:hypothetical protein n=1 Tax=unclassified Mesorhizobium TaxID=325217 RepID=UPI00112AB2E2|nr:MULTISPECIES: hypothetical protein [unclassified Mesorhizobium]TPJ11577.1 hypothetical protein FJW04_24825 [Mesorhizobium sp. B2-7-3]TPL64097.1 hypothetical protein FJ954_29750 [Mesorhizobium sp. B2-3-15]TPL85422.1 hypothetical protein FJ950_11690 [Mesorhizobium sp. B2-3-14]
MRKVVQLLLAVSLCGCVAAAPRPDTGDQRVNPIPISLALEEIITAGIRQRLPDSASARFGTMLAGERMLDGRQEIVVCGTVNASSGVGDKPFIAKVYPDAASHFELVAMGDETEAARLQIGGTCRAAGLPILDPKMHL